MPAHVPPLTSEQDLLLGYLRQQQDAFRAVAFGLTDAQIGRQASPSTLSVGSLLKHAAGVQRAWADKIAAAPERPSDAATTEQKMAEHAAQHTWTDEDSVDAVLGDFDEACRSTLAVIQGADLDAAVPVPRDAPWFPQDVESWPVRWVVLHLIQELARHAGHADIIREGIDGATMYELMAALEGWPETDWLKPWKPATTPATD